MAGALPAGDYKGKRAFRPCSKCGDMRPVGRTSAKVIVCLPCRRKAHGLHSDESVNEAKRSGRYTWAKKRGDCHRCGAPVPGGGPRWKYCTEDCFRKARNARGSGSKRTQERGYGYEHQLLRKKLLPLAYGTDCHLCGEVMNEGDRLHLDHTEDRSGYRGIVHDVCNVLDGAHRGGLRSRQIRLERGWRPGQDPSTRRRAQARTAA